MAFGICETFQNVISEYGDCCSQNTTEDGRAPKDRRIVQLDCFCLRQSCIIIPKHDFRGNSTSQIRLPTASIGQECESIRNPIQLDATDQADHRRGMHHQLFSPRATITHETSPKKNDGPKPASSDADAKSWRLVALLSEAWKRLVSKARHAHQIVLSEARNETCRGCVS